jgi:hypothetical protein
LSLPNDLVELDAFNTPELSHTPEQGWRHFAALSAAVVPKTLARAVELALSLAGE